jgi:hypothetical protein
VSPDALSLSQFHRFTHDQEEVMKFISTFVIAAAALALAPVASAASLTDCVQVGKQVSQALSSAEPGSSTSQARTEANSGRLFCATGMYAQGVARYTKALQLLGKA